MEKFQITDPPKFGSLVFLLCVDGNGISLKNWRCKFSLFLNFPLVHFSPITLPRFHFNINAWLHLKHLCVDIYASLVYPMSHLCVVLHFLIFSQIHSLTLPNNKKLLVILIFCQQFVKMSDLCRMCYPLFPYDKLLIATTIQEAIDKGHTDCVEVLFQIENYWSLSQRSPYKALVEAAQKGQFGLVKYLFQLKPTWFLADLQQILCEAVSRGHIHIMEFLIASAVNVEGQTPLILATIKGDEKMVKSVLQAGADVNKVGKFGNRSTALMIATRHGYLNITKVLLEAGADVNMICAKGTSFLNYRQDDVELVGEVGDTALIIAARNGHMNIIIVLVEAGADVNKICSKAPSFLEYTRDLDLEGKSDDTALIIAARKGHVNIIKVLVEAGADVNKIYNSSETALISLALNGNIQGVRLLLRSGAKVNTGNTLPLGTVNSNISHLLSAAGQTVMTRFLKSSTDTLHHHCRMVIRTHLLKLDLHENLFLRIPRLGLPSRLTKYLLFDTSLDENDT